MTGQNPTTTFDRVYDVILKRKQCSPEKSYVAYLMDEGTDMILKKICEESAEVIIAAKNENRTEQIHELAAVSYTHLTLPTNREV